MYRWISLILIVAIGTGCRRGGDPEVDQHLEEFRQNLQETPRLSLDADAFVRGVTQRDIGGDGKIDYRVTTYSRDSAVVLRTMEEVAVESNRDGTTVNQFYEHNELILSEVNLGPLRSLNLEPIDRSGVSIQLDGTGQIKTVIVYDNDRHAKSAFARDASGVLFPLSERQLRDIHGLGASMNSFLDSVSPK